MAIYILLVNSSNADNNSNDNNNHSLTLSSSRWAREVQDKMLAWYICCSQVLALLVQQVARQSGKRVVHLFHQLPC